MENRRSTASRGQYFGCGRFRALLALALLLTAPGLLAQERPDFTGEWRLNRQQSDDLQQKMREASRNESWLGRLFGSEKNVEEGWDSLQAPTTLKISLRDPELQLRDDDGPARTFYTDGRTQELRHAEGNPARVVTKWVGQEIISASETASGMKIKTLYKMGRGGSQLILSLYIESPRLREQVVVRYTYDFVAPVHLLAR